MPKTPAKAPSPVADFETALAQLETLVESMEGGEMTLEDSLGARSVGRFDTVEPHAPRHSVVAVADHLRATGADLVVEAMGGLFRLPQRRALRAVDR